MKLTQLTIRPDKLVKLGSNEVRLKREEPIGKNAEPMRFRIAIKGENTALEKAFPDDPNFTVEHMAPLLGQLESWLKLVAQTGSIGLGAMELEVCEGLLLSIRQLDTEEPTVAVKFISAVEDDDDIEVSFGPQHANHVYGFLKTFFFMLRDRHQE